MGYNPWGQTRLSNFHVHSSQFCSLHTFIAMTISKRNFECDKLSKWRIFVYVDQAFWREHMCAYFINQLWKRLRSSLLYFPSLLVPRVQWCQWNEPRLSKETSWNLYLVKRNVNTPCYLFWHKPINLGSTKNWKSNVTFPNENSWSFGAISIWDIRKSMSFLKESFGFSMSFH